MDLRFGMAFQESIDDNPLAGDEKFDEGIKTCKICYGVDEATGENEAWSAPCKCNGSIKWVHQDCMKQWIQNAPILQQSKCNTCKFPYKTCWSMKSFKKWCWPSLNLSLWDVVEIALDMYSTVKLVRGANAMIEGRKTVLGQVCYFIFWKIFIFNSRRIEYYKSLIRSMFGSFYEISFVDA